MMSRGVHVAQRFSFLCCVYCVVCSVSCAQCWLCLLFCLFCIVMFFVLFMLDCPLLFSLTCIFPYRVLNISWTVIWRRTKTLWDICCCPTTWGMQCFHILSCLPMNTFYNWKLTKSTFLIVIQFIVTFKYKHPINIL